MFWTEVKILKRTCPVCKRRLDGDQFPEDGRRDDNTSLICKDCTPAVANKAKKTKAANKKRWDATYLADHAEERRATNHQNYLKAKAKRLAKASNNSDE
jgi:hypothetical protein